MPVIQATYINIGGAFVNDDTNMVVTSMPFGGIAENEDTNAVVTQINLGAEAANEDTNALVTQIVFVVITAPGQFRELFSPLTSHDE